MKKGLCDKIDLLPLQDVVRYYKKLFNVLNDRKSSSDYGGMNNKDYADFSVDESAHNKLEIVEQKVYEEMFENRIIQLA